MEHIKQIVNRILQKLFNVNNDIFKIERFTDFTDSIVVNFWIRFTVGSADTIITILLSHESQVVNIESKILQKINL